MIINNKIMINKRNKNIDEAELTVGKPLILTTCFSFFYKYHHYFISHYCKTLNFNIKITKKN